MRRLLIAATLTALSSCGFITAGAASAASDEGATADAPAAMTGFAVESAETEPARIRFTLADAESDPVEVELLYDAPDPDGSDPLEAVHGARLEHVRPMGGGAELSNPMVLDASPQGVLHEFEWMFTQETSVPDTGGWTPGVFVYARITGGAQALTPGANAAHVALGNDPPVVVDADGDGFADAVLPTGEVVGLVLVSFRVSDSSEDEVAVSVEYALADGLDVDAGELPDSSSFVPATEAGAGVGAIAATTSGTNVDFVWDPIVDLGTTEHDVVLRITPDDDTPDDLGNPMGIGQAVLTRAFRVDNNAAPIVQLDSGALIANPDERRGIPVPYRVIDYESDLVDVIFQWRRTGEPFPSLPTDNAALDAILADEALRREHHVCSPYPHVARGRTVPVDATSVRLPELARGESWVQVSGLEGATLEFSRSPRALETATATWSSIALASPVAALPVGDGLTALVLDAPNGVARLREIELESGSVVRELAGLGPGVPTAMGYERGEAAMLVATDLGGLWRIVRVDLESGSANEVYLSNASDEPAPVRGIASLGTEKAVLTAGSSLLALRYGERAKTILTGLATPWGVAVDPLEPDRLYVSERDAPTPFGTGRVLAVNPIERSWTPVEVRSPDLLPAGLDRPEELALASGVRLVVATHAGAAQRIVAVELGALGANRSSPIGPELPHDVASLGVGPDDLLLACVSSGAGDVLVAGGLEQRSTVSDWEPSSQRVFVEAAFTTPPRVGQPWRMRASGRVRASLTGIERTFVWDAQADVGHGSAYLRAVARDSESGIVEQGTAPKLVRAGLDVAPLELAIPGGNGGSGRSVTAADLDSDGDLDVATTNTSGGLAVYFQTSPRSFALPPLLLATTKTLLPLSVEAADLDRDGDMDLVSANNTSDNLSIFYQDVAGFDPVPRLVGGQVLDDPWSVDAGDLDGDGDQDVACANFTANNLRAFFQAANGGFGSGVKVGGTNLTKLPAQVAIADLDEDGDLDLVSANVNDSNLTVFHQTGHGSFAASPQVVGGPALIGNVSSVTPSDLDGDGDQDLVATSALGTSIFLQTAPGSFDPAPIQIAVYQTHFAATANLDGDQDQDLFVVGGESVALCFQTAPGSFDAPHLLDLPDGAYGRNGTAADLDGDGRVDLAVVTYDNTLRLLFQSAPGEFDTAPLVVGGSTAFALPLDTVAADLDSDGDLDLVTADSLVDLSLFFQVVPGGFERSPGGLPADGPFDVVAADLDGDADLDLACASGFGNSSMMFFQASPGDFARSATELGSGNQPVDVASADMDGDGDLDLVSANFTNNLTVFLQSSPGNFDPSPIVIGGAGTTDNPRAVELVDFDADGDCDVVSANRDGNTLTVFRQASPRVFDGAPIVLGGAAITAAPFTVAVGDMDGNGRLDLVSANSGSKSWTIFFQTEPGVFDATPLVIDAVPLGLFVSFVTTADADGDGDTDMVATYGSELTVFFQRAPGIFDPQPIALQSGVNYSVAAADLDGDGEVDFASAGNLDRVDVYFGGH